MAKMTLPYVQVIATKGRLYAYYRRAGCSQRIRGGLRLGPPDGNGKRSPLPDTAWLADYERIHASHEAGAGVGPGGQRDPNNREADWPKGSLGALIVAFKASQEFLGLAAKTRKDYTRYLDDLAGWKGRLPVRTVPRPFVFKLRDRFVGKPRSGNYAVSVFRRLMTWGVDRGWRDDNPALRPGRLKEGPGHRPWEEWQVERFRETFGSDRLERVAFELLLNTGQRGQSIPVMTRAHVRRGRPAGLAGEQGAGGGVRKCIAVHQQKTGKRLLIPIAADLQAVLEPWLESHDHLVLLPTRSGEAIKIDHFRHVMRAAILDADLDGCTLHGLRYTAGTRLRELGLESRIIAAILGHSTAEMVRKYSEQEREATIAIATLDEARAGRHQETPEQ